MVPARKWNWVTFQTTHKLYPLQCDSQPRKNRRTSLTHTYVFPPGIRPSIHITTEQKWIFLPTSRGNRSCDGRSVAESGRRGKIVASFYDNVFRCSTVTLVKVTWPRYKPCAALGKRGGIAPTLSQARHQKGVGGQVHAPAALNPRR